MPENNVEPVVSSQYLQSLGTDCQKFKYEWPLKCLYILFSQSLKINADWISILQFNVNLWVCENVKMSGDKIKCQNLNMFIEKWPPGTRTWLPNSRLILRMF